jgi:hypothetical protein
MTEAQFSNIRINNAGEFEKINPNNPAQLKTKVAMTLLDGGTHPIGTMWTVIDGLHTCKEIEMIAKGYGYHVALGGSVMYRGSSMKDLDVIVYNHRRGTQDKEGFLKHLDQVGWREHVEWQKSHSTPSGEASDKPIAESKMRVYPVLNKENSKRIDLIFCHE